MKSRIYSIEALRLVAAFAVVAIHFSLKGIICGYIWTNLYFAVPFFYLVSGYFLKEYDSDELKYKVIRRMKRIFKIFICTAIIYLMINISYFVIYKGIDIYTYLEHNLSLNRVFNFIILNVWPFHIGGAIWFLQAMVYSYLFILLLIKTKLIKYESYIVIVLLILNAVFGEFSRWLGLPLVQASVFTRALPYMLLGRVIGNNEHKIAKIKKMHLCLLIITSAILCMSEYYLLSVNNVLGYIGHYQGNTLLSVTLLIFAIQNKHSMKNTVLYKLGAEYSLAIYLIHQPLGMMLEPHLGRLSIVSPIIIFVASFISAYIYNIIKKYIKTLQIKNI